MAAEYARVVGAEEAAGVDWEERMAKGLVVRYDKKGGGAAACVVRCDRDLENVWGEVEFAEAFIGDRRDGPVSASLSSWVGSSVFRQVGFVRME